MTDFQRLKTHLGKLQYDALIRLADATKVPFTTLYKIKNGETKNPRVKTVEKLIAGLAQ